MTSAPTMRAYLFARRNFAPEARSVEDSVMADIRLQIMHPHIIWNAGANRLGCLGLPDTRDIVVLTFDSQ